MCKNAFPFFSGPCSDPGDLSPSADGLFPEDSACLGAVWVAVGGQSPLCACPVQDGHCPLYLQLQQGTFVENGKCFQSGMSIVFGLFIHSSFFSQFPHLTNFKANNYKGCHIKSYIPPKREPISIGALRWSRPPMRAFRVTDTNMLVSKKPQIPIMNPTIQLSPCVGHNAALCLRYAQHEP